MLCVPGRFSLGKFIIAAFFILPMASCLSSGNPSFLPAPGVSEDLAGQRSSLIGDLTYQLHFHVPASDAEPVSGTLVAEFDLREATTPLVFDFRAPSDNVRSVLLNGATVEFLSPQDHIVIPVSALRAGRQKVTIEFVSTDTALNRQADFMYTLFVPDRASTAFPVFEQPDIKARYRLSLTIPRAWQALANGELKSRSADSTLSGMDTLEFSETLPVSSYLFAFAAGDLQIETAERNGRTYNMYHRETDPDSLSRNRDAIFDLHATAMEWLENYTRIDYPFGKFDFFAIPAFQFGGMEHPGAIWYRAESLFLDPGSSRNQQLSRASLIAHETAHMWFGDLVTMRWFNDVWMKEVFANFMAAKIAGPAYPELDLDLRFFLAHHPTAYAVDRTAGANPIRQQLENLRDAGSLYGAIIYQKAPVVMQQLELLLGEDVLQRGLRQYLTDYQFGNAGWPELIGILDRLSSDDLAQWSHAWVDEPGRPRVTSQWQDGKITVSQQDDVAGRAMRWRQPIVVAVGANGSVTEYTLMLNDDDESMIVPGATQMEFLLAGADGVGYARFESDARSQAWLTDNINALESALHRAVAWQQLWEDVLETRLDPIVFFQTLINGVELEQDQLIAQQILGLLRNVWWRYLPDTYRAEQAERVENVLWQAVNRVESAGQKGAYFSALVDMTLSAQGTQLLERIWRMEQVVEGLPLQEQQYISLAEALALREVPDMNAILDQQQERIANPDRLARFRFVRPAFSADPAEREAFFLSFAEPGNRRQESWVLDAARAIHHPIRSESSIALILPALGLLEPIQQTGDIFFPLRWLNATLDGHNSIEAAAIVRQFLEDEADMQPGLRAKLLQAADGLFRAAR